MTVLGSIAVEARHAPACEQAVHEKPGARRVYGEWSDVDADEALRAIEASVDARWTAPEALAEAVASEERRTGRRLDPRDPADARTLAVLAERVAAGGERGLLTQLHGLAG